jgi:hypothetical protein
MKYMLIHGIDGARIGTIEVVPIRDQPRGTPGEAS